jgi:DNA polymerase-4
MKKFPWLYLDLNSYFASVEQQLDPSLRGKPVAVGPGEVNTGTIIAASIEAKRFGVKTGTMVGDAKKMCPGIIFRNGGHERYVEVHHKILKAVDKVLPISAVLSIDELACQLLGREQEEINAVRLANEIKAIIRQDAGDYLSCSIGLAPNRYLAKVASDMVKPDGLVKITKEQLPQILHPLKLRDFPGIGARMEQRILRYGIDSVEKLCALDEDNMRLVWGGINGARFFQWLKGEDTEIAATQRRTIGHSHVLPPALRVYQKAELIGQKLLHKAAVRLRKNALWCGELHLSVDFLDGKESYHASLRLTECCDDLTLLEAYRKLWAGVPRFQKPLKVGVVFTRLVPAELHNLSLFADPRREKLSLAIDAINQRFSKETVQFASMRMLEEDAAPTRVAFTNIPDFSD